MNARSNLAELAITRDCPYSKFKELRESLTIRKQNFFQHKARIQKAAFARDETKLKNHVRQVVAAVELVCQLLVQTVRWGRDHHSFPPGFEALIRDVYWQNRNTAHFAAMWIVQIHNEDLPFPEYHDPVIIGMGTHLFSRRNDLFIRTAFALGFYDYLQHRINKLEKGNPEENSVIGH